MVQTLRKKVAFRRLKVDRLRAEGLTYVQIAKKLNVSTKTIKRDCMALDEEMAIEPAYTESRLKIREEFDQRFEELYEEILRDLDEARKPSVTIELVGSSGSKKKAHKKSGATRNSGASRRRP
jgi:IS30 family transposase